MGENEMVERVSKPAALMNGVVFSLVAPGTHHFELYEALAGMGLIDDASGQPQSGFLTTTGRFVDLNEANVIRSAALSPSPHEPRG